MKRRRRSFLLAALLLAVCPACASLDEDSGKTYPYGGRIKYLDHRAKKLPDFSI